MEAGLVALIGLGGLYTISKQNNNREPFETNKKDIVENYPVEGTEDLKTNVNHYVNPNVASDRYFNQDVYKNEVRKNNDVGSNLPTQQYSLTGEPLNITDFKHSNMKPFFGSKSRGFGAQGNNYHLTTESVLDSKAGAGSQHMRKKERGALFKPEENVQWAHGAPNMTDFYRSRVNPSASMANVKPFESKHIGPGLDKGYGIEGNAGFNSGMEARELWQPKTVDDLRVATNPKVTYGLQNHEGPAAPALKSMVERGQLGNVEKYAPDTYFVNGPERYLTTTGLEKGPTSRAMEVLPFENRSETSMEYQGIATGDYKKAKTKENYLEPARDHVYGSVVGGPTREGGNAATDGDYGKHSFISKPNNRNTTQPSTQMGGVQAALGAVVAPLLDILKPSRKENSIGNKRLSGNVQKYGAGGEYVINPADKLKTTNKEMTVDSKFHLNIQGQSQDAYMLNRPVAGLTQRTTTSCNDYGNAMSTGEGHRLEGAVRNQRNNNNKHIVGYTPSGNTSVLNSELNVHIDTQRGVNNKRLSAPNMPQGPPSASNYGKISGPQYYDQNASCDRIQPDILDAFKKNPYTHSLSSTR
tara:strand:+ start:972 stop:2723 length:1752 start_codon:yes stop_codon:yes gene_type:complete